MKKGKKDKERDGLGKGWKRDIRNRRNGGIERQ